METYGGHVKTPADAIILFEACRIGLLPRVQRRLSEKERQQIKSGSVFVWDEREAGMRRWTDGKSWSASRVSGSFLTYREMEGKRGGNGYSTTPQPQQKKPSPKLDSKSGDSEEEGPDGYRYKPDGLMKQSFSITTSSGQHLHLISYYSRSSPNAGVLLQPSTDPNLRHIRPPKNMYPESTVNESANIPAVTRGPMASPHYSTGSPQPMAGSPFSRPSMAPAYIPQGPGWPPTPSATPPTAYAVYYPYGPPPPGHSPMHFAQVHPHHAYPAHIAPPTHLDRAPPPIGNTQIPQHLINGHASHVPHYTHHASPRHSISYSTTQPQGGPYSQYATAPEPGPQLPQLQGHVNGDPRQQSPRPGSGGKSQSHVVSLPETNSSSTPARHGPVTALSSILNGAPNKHTTNGEQNNSRSGSKSPVNSGFAPMKLNESTAPLRAANQAINALNSAALST